MGCIKCGEELAVVCAECEVGDKYCLTHLNSHQREHKPKSPLEARVEQQLEQAGITVVGCCTSCNKRTQVSIVSLYENTECELCKRRHVYSPISLGCLCTPCAVDCIESSQQGKTTLLIEPLFDINRVGVEHPNFTLN